MLFSFFMKTPSKNNITNFSIQLIMKTTLVILFLFFTGLFQSALAQDLSLFYQPSDKNADYKYDKKLGYQLTSKSSNSGEMVFEPANNATIDLEFTVTSERQYGEGTVFTVSFGDSKTIDFVLPFGNSNREYIQINGKKPEYSPYFITNYASNNDGNNSSLSFTLRIAQNNIQTFQQEGIEGYMLGNDVLPIDSRILKIKAVSEGKSSIDVKVATQFIASLSSMAYDGLNIRKSADLNSTTIGSIPYGEKVYALDGLDGDEVNFFLASTEGNLKVGNLSSKMVKVLYKDKIGYAYGGYLLPINRVEAAEKETENHFEGWLPSFEISNEVFLNKQLVIKNISINFDDYYYTKMDVSQRALLLTRLFPNVLSEEKIKPLLHQNKKHTIEISKDGFIEKCVLSVEGSRITHVEYEKARDGFFAALASNKKAYIVASELNMRASSDPKSSIITKIPFGASVSITSNSESPFLVIGGIRGKMTKIKYNNQEGYVFDAYLSPTQPLPAKKDFKQNPSLTFNNILKERGFAEWQHHTNKSINKDDGRYQWMVVPSRDKFQAIKTLSQLCPFINDISFSWNEKTQSYDLISKDMGKLGFGMMGNQWYITYITDESDYAAILIMVETISENLQKVSVTIEEMGC